MTVRFVDGRPSQIFMSQHTDGQSFTFGDKNLNLDQERPTVYAANGSHGLYPDAARHVYKHLPNGDFLADDTAAGTLWDTGSTVVPFEWQSTGSYADSLSWLNITSRWGNPKSGCALVEDATGECVLNDGPEAPMTKSFSQPSSTDLK
jgi:hypothetical protein